MYLLAKIFCASTCQWAHRSFLNQPIKPTQNTVKEISRNKKVWLLDTDVCMKMTLMLAKPMALTLDEAITCAESGILLTIMKEELKLMEDSDVWIWLIFYIILRQLVTNGVRSLLLWDWPRWCFDDNKIFSLIMYSTYFSSRNHRRWQKHELHWGYSFIELYYDHI